MGKRKEVFDNAAAAEEEFMQEGIRRLQEVCKPYGMDAFQFVLGALEYTQQRLPERRHVTGKELLDGIIAYGKEEFGPMALTVFGHWGIRSTEDFGAIVFKMVEAGILSKTQEDSLADFQGAYDLQKAFEGV